MMRLIHRVLRWKDANLLLWRLIAVAIAVLSIVCLVVHDLSHPDKPKPESEPKTISLPTT